MRIDDLTERRIKEAASIVDVVGDFLTLKRAGAEYTALCPFHQDRHTGSFMVSPRKNIAHCFPCGKTLNPVDFVMEMEGLDYPDALRWLAQKYGIFIDDAPKFKDIRPSKPRPPMPPPPPLTKRLWPLEWVRRFKADETDTFIRWLYTLPWDDAQRARLPKVITNYGIGHSHFVDKNRDGTRTAHDFTIFWQVDEQANLHNGHFMKYREDGHREKDKDKYPTTWIHARMKRAKQNPFDEDKEEASYCLFGQHLMAVYPDATVNIVESEKTAIIMATAYGAPRLNLWMACCGLGNLTNSHRLLQPLIDQGKRIVLYPDKDGLEKWKKAAREIDYKRLTLYTDHLTQWWRPEDGEKADIADIVLRMIGDHQTNDEDMPHRLRELIKENPVIQNLVNKLHLKVIK
ncbi:MAG: hypothetical protein IJR87_00645 [Bacteroidaceae bacterium]|nr:hypothetical protein [Bacteroidaceae bacterium]